MNANPYLKKLKAFDPKSDLTVNESFKYEGDFAGANDIFEGADDSMPAGEGGADSGKEIASFRVGQAVSAGLAKAVTAEGGTALIACDTAGGVFILSENQGNFEVLTKFKIPGSIIKKPAYADGVLYITTREGLVCAVNTGLVAGSSGQQKAQMLWQKKLAKGIHTEPVATGKLLILAALDGLYAFEAYYKSPEEKAIGRELWCQQIAGGTVSSPLLEGGIIYLGTEEKKLIAVEYGGDKARIAWSFDASAQIRARPSLATKTGSLLFPSLDGAVYCLDKAQKKLRWVFIVKSPVMSTILPVVIDGNEYFFFGADDGFFYCVNDSGKEVWKYKTNGKIRTEAVHREGIVYFGSEDNNFYALNAKKGALIFKFSTDGNINGAPVIIDDRIYFGSSDAFVHGVRA